ncbi:hypothetical protein C8R43DRAFT_1137029 [Mycena crocata]|nr:hypothetical protein C8R43DRAFT_1137029 [Mycena crocata]
MKRTRQPAVSRRGGAPPAKRRNTQAKLPQTYTHDESVSQTLGVSRDGRRWSSVAQGLGSSTSGGALFATEQMAEEAMNNIEDFYWGQGDYPQGDDEDFSAVKVVAKRSDNSDIPLRAWLPYRPSYLFETLRAEGRGGEKLSGPTCKKCKTVISRVNLHAWNFAILLCFIGIHALSEKLS